MHKLNRTLFAALFIALAGATTAAAQTAAEVNKTIDELNDEPGAHVTYQKFFDKLKKAVAENDKQTVAAMVDYPFKAQINGKSVTIRDATHFAADYDKIFTAKIKQAVAKQTYATLFANQEGVMIGDGEVWFGDICSDDSCTQSTIRITAVND